MQVEFYGIFYLYLYVYRLCFDKFKFVNYSVYRLVLRKQYKDYQFLGYNIIMIKFL